MSTITRTMIDVHMHLIPGVDDGAADLQMAEQMLLQAREQGISCIFATPHSSAFDRSYQHVLEQYAQLCDLVDRSFPDMDINPGCEVYCEPEGMDRVLAALKRGRYFGMWITNYVLMEFSMWASPEEALFCVEAVAKAGYRPIVAHMERYFFLRGNMELVDRLIGLGAKIQVNAYSLFEEKEETVKTFARSLIAQQKVCFLGTDAHRTDHRPPNVKTGLDWLYDHCAQEYADAVAWKNAKLLLCVD